MLLLPGMEGSQGHWVPVAGRGEAFTPQKGRLTSHLRRLLRAPVLHKAAEITVEVLSINNPGAHVASEKKPCRAILWWKKGTGFSLKTFYMTP